MWSLLIKNSNWISFLLSLFSWIKIEELFLVSTMNNFIPSSPNLQKIISRELKHFLSSSMYEKLLWRLELSHDVFVCVCVCESRHSSLSTIHRWIIFQSAWLRDRKVLCGRRGKHCLRFKETLREHFLNEKSDRLARINDFKNVCNKNN